MAEHQPGSGVDGHLAASAGGRGTRLFLTHEGFDPDDEFQRMARRVMGGGGRTGVSKALARVLDEMPD
ncbi:hypothetical protein P3102_18060 [Amycolatopsis sp. QT-25]|uniref:hypothetical protein n=1 Tax=Amycolatopsis sp. QT-25 TaxID=3034022 RepID=UPI0023ED1447|nr:hypothetical protein [Amycolatopsis sp. QT-25]WET82973.1 hypothetical protein P3102_18060 [Amycolatopsis sp. QT-25]